MISAPDKPESHNKAEPKKLRSLLGGERPLTLAGKRVHLAAMGERGLCGFVIFLFALPHFERGEMQRAAVAERERPRIASPDMAEIHLVQMRGGIDVGLPS